MKKFTKLALATSILAMSANTMAMTALDDATLGATTGQEGITVNVQLNDIKIKELYVHDNDGYNGSNDAGAIVIKGNGAQTDGIVVTRNGGIAGVTGSTDFLRLNIDTDGGAGAPFLNIAADVAAMDISIAEIGVGKSDGYNAATNARTAATGYSSIIEGITLNLGTLSANIQLGNTPQGAMIVIDSTINGGLALSDLALKDNGTNGQGSIVIDSIKVTDYGSANMVVDAKVNVKPDGLEITSLSPADGHNIYVEGIHLGSATQASIGDISIVGMKTTSTAGNGSTIRITGH